MVTHDMWLPAWAGGSLSAEAGVSLGQTFLSIAFLLLAAKLAGVVQRWGQPAVLGELVLGILLGNLHLLGLTWFEGLKGNDILHFLAEFGVVILLFQVGLESNVQNMFRVGGRALAVAVVGVTVPFVLGTWLVGPFLLPGFDFNAYLFLGAILTATSVGITARVFRDFGRLQTPEAQIVLGAAIIDDVIGLIILAVVSAVVTVGTVSFAEIAWITTKAVLFLAGAVFLGQLLAPRLSLLLSRVHSGLGMKFTLAISFGLGMAYLAEQIGLAPIVGAFAAGLVLDPVHFRGFEDSVIVADVRRVMADLPAAQRQRLDQEIEAHADRHVEDLLEPVGHLLSPIFFVLTGMGVAMESLWDSSILLAAVGITVVAFASKIVAGTVAGKVNRWLVGWGMVPRGEVGLIFAAAGRTLGVINEQVFSVVVIVVVLSTLLTPPILGWLLKRK